MLIIEGSGSGKANALLNLNKNKIIDNICLYVKDLNEPKYQFLVKKLEGAGIKHDLKAFIEFSVYMDDVYNNIND